MKGSFSVMLLKCYLYYIQIAVALRIMEEKQDKYEDGRLGNVKCVAHTKMMCRIVFVLNKIPAKSTDRRIMNRYKFFARTSVEKIRFF